MTSESGCTRARGWERACGQAWVRGQTRARRQAHVRGRAQARGRARGRTLHDGATKERVTCDERRNDRIIRRWFIHTIGASCNGVEPTHEKW